MDVTWLESLLALLEHGSFSRAAEVQHISQPALSRRIRALEHWAGAELVDRSTYPVSLTPAGAALRDSANEVVSSLGAVRDELRGSQLMPRDAVRIAISHTLATHYFSTWWADVNSGGELRCVLLPANTLEGYDALLHGGCDLLLAYTDPAQPVGIEQSDIEWLVLARDRLVPYSRREEGRAIFTLPGSPRRPVPVVSHGPSAFLGRVTDRLWRVSQLYLRPVVQSDLSSALAALVRAGVGVGWLPQLLVKDDLAAGDVTEIGDSSYSADLEIRLLRSRTRKTSPRARTLWQRAGGASPEGSSGIVRSTDRVAFSNDCSGQHVGGVDD
jgi:DNA-binding transcriptional LysR family regulator